MKKWIILIIAVVMTALPGLAIEFPGKVQNAPLGQKTVFAFPSTRVNGDYTTAIPSCPSMRVTWVRGSGAVVFLMGTEPTDDTIGEIAGATLIDTFTTSESITVPQSHMFFRLLVSTAESAGSTSYAEVTCGSNVGGGGGVNEGTFAQLPVDDGNGPLFFVTDCATAACSAGGGTVGVLKEWNGTAWSNVATGSGIASVFEDPAPALGGPLDPNGESIGVRNFYVANDTELASALTSCDAGIGQNKQTGCTIYLEGGQYTMSSTRALAGDGTAAQGRNGLKIVGMGGGYGPANSNQYPNAGTVISWTGGASPMFTMGAGMLTLVDVAIDGNGAATDGIDILNSSGAPNKLHFERVSFYGFTDCAIEGADGGQFDESTFEHVYIEQSACAIRTSHSQSIGITLGPKFQVTNMTGSGPFIDAVAGSVLLKDSYCGLVSDGQTCVHFGQGANQFRIENTQFEGPGAARTGLVFIDADDGGLNQEVRELIVKDSQFIIGGAGNTALDFLGRGNLVWEDNNFVDTDAGVADSLAITIDRDSGSANNRLRARIANNWRNNQGTRVPERWLPTIDQTVDVQSPIYSADIRPESCAWWEVARDTNETSGAQLYACEAGSWVLQGGGGGSGDVTSIGNASVGAVCSSGDCFEGVGTEDNLAATGDFKIRVDYDLNGSNKFIVQNGSGVSMLEAGEITVGGAYGGVVGLGTMNATGSVTANTSMSTATLSLGSATGDGTLFLYNDNDPSADSLVIIQADSAGGTAAYKWPSTGIVNGRVLQTDGSGNLSWVAQSGGGGVTDGGAISYLTGTSDAFAIGGSTSSAPFYFDPATGTIEINVAGGSIDIDAHATQGGSLSVKEGADDGTNIWTLKAPDGGLDASYTHTLSATGQIPATAGGTGLDSSSATGIPRIASGVWSASTDLPTTTTMTTPSVGDSDTSLATTAFVQNETAASGQISGTLGSGLNVADGSLIADDFAADAVGEPALDLINGDTPADEDCLTYENGTGGTLEFQPCGGGAWDPIAELDNLRTKPIYYDDLLGGGSADNAEPVDWLDFAANGSGTLELVGDAESLFTQENHPGIIAIRASATANSGGLFSTAFNGGQDSHIDLDGGEMAEIIFQMKESSGVIVRMGFIDTSTEADVTDGAYIEINNSLTPTCRTANAGTRTTSANIATLSIDTWYRARVTINADKTQATCQIWNDAGTPQGSQTNSANLPADNLLTNFGVMATHTAGNGAAAPANHIVWLDWMALGFGRTLTR